MQAWKALCVLLLAGVMGAAGAQESRFKTKYQQLSWYLILFDELPTVDKVAVLRAELSVKTYDEISRKTGSVFSPRQIKDEGITREMLQPLLDDLEAHAGAIQAMYDNQIKKLDYYVARKVFLEQLANIYSRDDIPTYDPPKARLLLEKAYKEVGSTSSALVDDYLGGKNGPKQISTAISMLEKDVERSGGSYQLATIYEKGYHGIAADPELAFRHHKKVAVAFGLGPSCQYVGKALEAGLGGVTKDLGAAMFWYSRCGARDEQLTEIKERVLPHLDEVTLSVDKVQVRKHWQPEVVATIARGEAYYSLAAIQMDGELFEGVYVPAADVYGLVRTGDLESKPKVSAARSNAGPFPPRPAPQAGRTVCATNCNNADCYRTYDDGRQVRFQAKQAWDVMSNTFKFDPGSC